VPSRRGFFAGGRLSDTVPPGPTTRTDDDRDPADLASRTFELRTTWRSVLPDDPPTDALVRRRVDFDADPTARTTNQFERTTVDGSPASLAANDGAASVANHSDAHCRERYLPTGRAPEPHFATLLRVSEWSGAARPSLGVRTDTGAVSIGVDGGTRAIGADATFGDVDALFRQEAPEPPFDLLVTWLGARAVVHTRSAGGHWTCHGRVEWDGEPYADWKRRPWRPWWGYDLDSGASLSVDRFWLLGTAGFGVRDPTLVTRRDGTPLMDGRHVYLACSAGAPGFGYSYQTVLRLHVDTFEIELAGLLFADTGGGSCYPDNAAHVVYDDRTDEFVVAFSGFGTKHLGPDDEVAVYVGRTGRDVRHGTHVVDAEPANLPTRSQAWDAYLVFDEAADAWRCAHTYDGAGAIAVSETTDESLTGGWEPLHVYDGANEGTKLVAVDGEYRGTYTDYRAS